MGLPALAQLSNTTSTFSGQVAATCQINNLAENIDLNYYELNWLSSGYRQFQLITNNSTVRIHSSRMTIVSEPSHTSAIKARIRINKNNPYGDFEANKISEGFRDFSTSSSEPNDFTLNVAIFTDLVEGRYTLPSGNYSYRATISCLQ